MGRGYAMACRVVLPAISSCALVWALLAVGASSELVLDVNGNSIHFEKTFAILDAETGVTYPFGFFFGNGSPTDAVNTGTEISLGRDGNTSQVLACEDGEMVLVDHSGGLPEKAGIRVSYNSTSDFYQIHISESSASTVQLSYCSHTKGIFCSEDAGTPMHFRLDTTSSSTRQLPSRHRHAPANLPHNPRGAAHAADLIKLD